MILLSGLSARGRLDFYPGMAPRLEFNTRRETLDCLASECRYILRYEGDGELMWPDGHSVRIAGCVRAPAAAGRCYYLRCLFMVFMDTQIYPT